MKSQEKRELVKGVLRELLGAASCHIREALQRVEGPTAVRPELTREEEIIICQEVHRRLSAIKDRVGV